MSGKFDANGNKVVNLKTPSSDRWCYKKIR